MKNMWQWQEPGTEKGPWLIGAGVALALLLVIVLVLAFWWSRAPKPHTRPQPLRAMESWSAYLRDFMV